MKGILRILKSSKGVAALASIVGIILVHVLKLEPALAKDLTTYIVILAVAYIGGTTLEDSAAKFRKGDTDEKPDDGGGAGSS